mgnify:FL=1
MGCLKVITNRIGDGIHAHSARVGEGIRILADRMGGMKVTCGLVCSVNKVRYLNVEPKAIFLMAGNDFRDDVLVIANVDWQVK